jgi:hypothetical protein
MSYLSEELDDEELGFIDTAAKAAIGLGKGLAKVFKKKKKKKPPANKVTQMEAQNITGTVPKDDAKAVVASLAKSAIKAKDKARAKGLDAAAVKDIVREVVGSVPSPVRQVVLDALKAASDAGAQKNQTLAAIQGQVDEALKPQVLAMLGALQAQNTSAQATYEHRELVNREDFHRSTKEGMANILARLDQVETNLDQRLKNPKLALVTRKLPFFGPKNVLEG